MVDWREVLGNRALMNPIPEMLEKSGYEIVRNCAVAGESKARVNRASLKRVQYDRDYVVYWIALKLGSILTKVSDDEWRELCKEAKQLRVFNSKSTDLGGLENPENVNRKG